MSFGVLESSDNTTSGSPETQTLGEISLVWFYVGSGMIFFLMQGLLAIWGGFLRVSEVILWFVNMAWVLHDVTVTWRLLRPSYLFKININLEWEEIKLFLRNLEYIVTWKLVIQNEKKDYLTDKKMLIHFQYD